MPNRWLITLNYDGKSNELKNFKVGAVIVKMFPTSRSHGNAEVGNLHSQMRD